MGKLIFWIVVIFVAMFVLRIYNAGQLRRRSKEDTARNPAVGSAAPGEQMVRCARCGIFLPRSEALLIGGAIRCRDQECAAHG